MKRTGGANSGEKQREFEIERRRKRKRRSKYSEVKNGSVRTSNVVKG